jgi:hypothetical protein
MLEAVISLETFLFVEWNYAELADLPGFTPFFFFFVSCTNNTDSHPFQHFRTAAIRLDQIGLLA